MIDPAEDSRSPLSPPTHWQTPPHAESAVVTLSPRRSTLAARGPTVSVRRVWIVLPMLFLALTVTSVLVWHWLATWGEQVAADEVKLARERVSWARRVHLLNSHHVALKRAVAQGGVGSIRVGVIDTLRGIREARSQWRVQSWRVTPETDWSLSDGWRVPVSVLRISLVAQVSSAPRLLDLLQRLRPSAEGFPSEIRACSIQRRSEDLAWPADRAFAGAGPDRFDLQVHCSLDIYYWPVGRVHSGAGEPND